MHSRVSRAGRRRILQAGIAGSVLLFALSGRRAWAAREEGGPSDPASLRRLGADEAAVLRAIVPVVLAGALPAEKSAREGAIAEVIRGIDTTLEHEPPAVRAEIQDLFGLLTFGATRVLVAGVWRSWESAKEKEIQDFLAGWRDSRFTLLRSAYVGLQNLVVAAWYASPRSWARIGYPGAPTLS